MNEWVDRWNDRYSNDEFAYGEQPNNYLKEQLKNLVSGLYSFQQKAKDVMRSSQPVLVGKFQPLTSVCKEK